MRSELYFKPQMRPVRRRGNAFGAALVRLSELDVNVNHVPQHLRPEEASQHP